MASSHEALRKEKPLSGGLPSISPDFVEQDGHETAIDQTLPPRDPKSPLMIGLGASEAFKPSRSLWKPCRPIAA
jgi:hypothetical protein